MALVHLLSTAPAFDPATGRGSDELRRLRDAAGMDRFKVHRLTPDPQRADLIMFVDAARPDLRDVRDHPLYASHLEKCFVVHHGDRIYPFVPGIYTCAEKRTHPRSRSSTGCYLTVSESPHFRHSIDQSQPYLFSFVGRSETSEVRRRLTALVDPRGLVMDTSTQPAVPVDRYAEIIRQSSFVLCPRGYGAASYRLFEALKSGRAPVLLADDWVPPVGPDWHRFAVFVRESQVDEIPALLAGIQPKAQDMGRAARQAWDEWFSTEVAFHRYVEACLDMLRRRRVPERWARYRARAKRLRLAAGERVARMLHHD
jgi:hypothetical protein